MEEPRTNPAPHFTPEQVAETYSIFSKINEEKVRTDALIVDKVGALKTLNEKLAADIGYQIPSPSTAEQKREQQLGLNRDASAYHVAQPSHVTDAGTIGALGELGARLGIGPTMGGNTLLNELANAGAGLKQMSAEQQARHFEQKELECERAFAAPEKYQIARAAAVELLKSLNLPLAMDIANSKAALTNPIVVLTLYNHSRTLAALRKK